MTRGFPGTTLDHGTTARRKAGCGCTPCRKAQYMYDKTRYQRPGYVCGVGTVRRLQALAVMGWSWPAIAQELNISPGTVSMLLSHASRAQRVEWRTERKVTRLYDDLCMTPGPSAISRKRAIAKGWVSGLAWDDIDDPNESPTSPDGAVLDEVAVRRVIDGGRAELTKPERLVVIEALAAQGIPDRQIATRVGVTERTVCRDRQAAGIESRWVA